MDLNFQKENENLRKENENLRKENESLKREKVQCEINVDKYVEELLNDESINIGYLPDGVEKAMYRNAITLMLNLFKKIANESSVNLLGHTLKFQMNMTANN